MRELKIEAIHSEMIILFPANFAQQIQSSPLLLLCLFQDEVINPFFLQLVSSSSLVICNVTSHVISLFHTSKYYIFHMDLTVFVYSNNHRSSLGIVGGAVSGHGAVTLVLKLGANCYSCVDDAISSRQTKCIRSGSPGRLLVTLCKANICDAYWIPQISCTLPPNASHQVGVGGFVLNDKNQISG
ncbi:uncharacterized protein LOC131076079 isoform X6 [Cryptomeria japonica]|uniref:uncharacterized protein LOC131076079 isoform X6 n=1 Tax=Cryptomeria japonica TaxID=3369 RepID=UPI0025AC0EF1|nr:uncharacterized protein LOC131076079 isoform X6 [Cryptomeria japonica]